MKGHKAARGVILFIVDKQHWLPAALNFPMVLYRCRLFNAAVDVKSEREREKEASNRKRAARIGEQCSNAG